MQAPSEGSEAALRTGQWGGEAQCLTDPNPERPWPWSHRAARPTPPMTSTRYEDNADVLTEKVPYLLRAMGDREFPLTGAAYELMEVACKQDTHVDWWGGDDNVNWKSMSTCLEGVLPAEWDACAPLRCAAHRPSTGRVGSSPHSHAARHLTSAAHVMCVLAPSCMSRPRQRRAAGSSGAAAPTEPRPEPCPKLPEPCMATSAPTHAPLATRPP